MRFAALATAVLLAFPASVGLRAGQIDKPQVPPELVGCWSGTADIAVNWTIARTIDVHLDVFPDGEVIGTIGDATLRHAHVRSNRGAVARWFRIKTDWVIAADLDGDLIAAEHIRRASVRVLFDVVRGDLMGGFHTSGWKVGGTRQMIFSAARMKLERWEIKTSPRH